MLYRYFNTMWQILCSVFSRNAMSILREVELLLPGSSEKASGVDLPSSVLQVSRIS